MTMDVAIVGAARTPVGNFLSDLAPLTAPKLGALAIAAAIERSGLSARQVEQVVMGNVLSGGVGQAPARQASRGAGIPDTTPTVTVNKVCGSGLQAVVFAAQSVAAGDVEVAVAGGMESMSNAPYFTPRMRTGARMGNQTLFDLMIHDGLTDAYDNIHMGVCAEACAETFQISRQAQDDYARMSTERAIRAQNAGEFKREIVPVLVPVAKGEPRLVSEDEGPRTAQVAKLSGLKPVFKKDGTVTAGNASSINDGAAAVVLISLTRARELKLPVLGIIRGHASAARTPVEFTIAPNDAMRLLLKRMSLLPSQIDAWEINEAFAVVSLANNRLLELDAQRVNMRGGAICLGHPIGASGARLLVTLVHLMEDRKLSKGVVSLCVGGGEGIAMLVER